MDQWPGIPVIFSVLALLIHYAHANNSKPEHHVTVHRSSWTALRYQAPVAQIMEGAVGINVPAVEGSENMYTSPDDFLPELDNGPAHYPGNALPWQNGTAIFSGHRTTHTLPFHNLGYVSLGQYVVLRTHGHGVLRYRIKRPPPGHPYVMSGYGITDAPCALRHACAVLHVSVDHNRKLTRILQKKTRWVFRWHLKTGHWLLLMACTPFHDKNYRLAVFAEEVK